ncbi:hypothetical protein [Streptomyces sp. NPDC056405]|uniref:beta family protein n=1 Tax=Streptomyces sp. NPDC056405 TaxID=3345811 RepID=UPI0035D68427
MSVDPVYVPVLPVRRGAWQAYARLGDAVRPRVAPLWTLVPRTGAERTRGVPGNPEPEEDRVDLERWLPPRVDQLADAARGMPGWVDAGHMEALLGAAPGLWRLLTGTRLRPVTGPERSPALQRYAADLAFLTGRGIGIRVLADTTADEPDTTALLALVDRLCLPPSRIDLIVDVGPVADAADGTKLAVTALDLLSALAPWRTVVLTAGAFPRLPEHPDSGPFLTVPRHDRQLHRGVRAARPAFPRRLLYGDYSVEHALSVNLPHIRPHAPPWGLLRYTGPDGYLLARVPTRGGADRVDQVRGMARRITRSPAFRGAEYSDGEAWLHACAGGDGRAGSGNAETWIRAGHVQHMTFVVEQLLGGTTPHVGRDSS